MSSHHHHHHHHHHHATGPDFDDWAARADDLERGAEVGLPWIEAANDWLAELQGNQPLREIVDIGSGPGVWSVALARRFPDARVTAVDRAKPLLTRVLDRAERLGVRDRVAVAEGDLEGDMSHLPSADVILASHVLHHVADQVQTLRALATRLRPGGLMVVAEGGLPLRFLPDECGIGTPGLAARLDAVGLTAIRLKLAEHYAPGVARPTLDWGFQLAEAGLTPTGTRSFLLDLPAPVSPAVRAFVHSRLTTVQGLAPGALSPADEAALAALLDPENPLGVMRRPDLFLLTAYTVHTARA